MTQVFSLRARLTIIILVPLILIVSLVGFWQLQRAQDTAREVFERALITAALAVTNDVAISDGDALSPSTVRLLEDTSGGPVFYHVYAPDGVIVAGYATPPVGIPSTTGLARPLAFDAVYRGSAVTGVRLQTQTEIEGFSGTFTTTVWQDQAIRDRFVRDLVTGTGLGLVAVLVSLALVVWFGVRLGLRPLTDLEKAIALRSSDDLTEIQRAVPVEVHGVVNTLNALFRQVRGTLEAQSQFIANAAHQLRNPIAGVLSLAEAVERAKTPDDMRERTQDLLASARTTATLTQRLLLHERAKALSPGDSFETCEVQALLDEWVPFFEDLMPDGVSFRYSIHLGDAKVLMDPVMIKEALTNLIDNAVMHGGNALTIVTVTAEIKGAALLLTVSDDGQGIPDDLMDRALKRFEQIGPSQGSGLGLSIVQTILQAHGGDIRLRKDTDMFHVELSLPL